MLTLGVIDAAITAEIEFMNREDRTLFNYMPLREMETGIVVPHNHPALGKENLSITDFCEDCFISLNDFNSDADNRANRQQMRLLGITKQLKADNIETLGIMVEAGMGIAALNSGHKLASNPRFRFISFPELQKITDVVLWMAENNNQCIAALTDAMHKNGFSI